MIAVIPFCEKDAWLALRNVEWAKQLDGHLDFDAVLSYDENTSSKWVEQIRALASGLFRSVTDNRYDPPYKETWPHAANHAWQKAAWRMYDHHRNQSWLWWEADATPLRAGWLMALELAHKDGGRLFSGHIVMGDGKLGHMNGVGIYPWDVVERSAHAMTCRASPFDVVLKGDVISDTHPLNHLICHFPRANGTRVSVGHDLVATELLKRGYVLFHGCTDGSLLRILSGEPPQPELNGEYVRYYEIKDIGAPLDQAEANWQFEHVRLRKDGWPTISFEECQEDMPPIAEQTSWPIGFFGFPITRNVCHFNCSITRDGEGQLWLFVRRWERRGPKDWHSRLLACRINKMLDVVSTQEVSKFDDPFVQLEDPRAIWREGKFFISLCFWSQAHHYEARQMFIELNDKLELVADSMPPYGFNDPDADTPETGAREKNWVWFNHEGQWMFVYQYAPHTVVTANGKTVHVTDSPKQWPYGEIRGGTPPVRVGDEYLTFFHSSLPWKKRQKRYYVGAYCFEATPPFRVTRITTKPLLAGSEHDPRMNGGPLVVFPCGNVFDGKDHLVSFGVNDEACAWIRIPHTELLERMEPCNTSR